MEVISRCWNEQVACDPYFVFLHKLKKLKNILKDWNWKVFGDIHVKIKEVEEEVHKAMELSDSNPSNTEALDRLVNAENTYNSKEVQLKTMLKQKARIKWVKEGYANTSFFHTNLKVRQSRNFISELEDINGDIISDQNKIADTLVQHFEKKIQYKAAEEVDSLLEVIPEVIIKEDQQMLDAIPSAEAIFSMDPESAPGPDGFSGCFYRACWHIIYYYVVHAIQFCWRRRFIPKGLNSNFLVLLPKIEGAKSPNHFRPIGLSNVSFKIITKIINTRMISLMTKIITPQQVAYIKGKSIQEQIILASEIVNEMRKKRRGVMINGGPHGFFSVVRGLRQGDPLSPTLFVIMEDVLSRCIHKMV
ncbi:uncharacterized protein LOC113272616 [Papaver somniferum]|uniref:uncharacterized protein LOC113272616 n=1 Tax=Papaver somniferum TaxID=3469 RepID=UPI000E6FE20D|nr:uncharacterized protein LOC113272616 [Papaver somniferum]